MRRVIPYAVLAIGLLVGWKLWADAHRPTRDLVLLVNATGRQLSHVRLRAGRETFESDSIAAGRSASFRFRVTGDTPFVLHWQAGAADVEHEWSGGRVIAGPMRTRHRILVSADGGVVWSSERMSGAAK